MTLLAGIVGWVLVIVAIVVWVFSKVPEKALMKGWWCKKCRDFVEMKKTYPYNPLKPVCSICGKGVRMKGMPPEYDLKSQKLREEGI